MIREKGEHKKLQKLRISVSIPFHASNEVAQGKLARGEFVD
jgi:predicted RNA binding protein YcfA (HicA-like mRNA interferase family)